jgi:hypothetical protein
MAECVGHTLMLIYLDLNTEISGQKNCRLLLNPIREKLFPLPIQARLEIIVGKTPRPVSIEAPVYFEFGRHGRVRMFRKFVKRWVNTNLI